MVPAVVISSLAILAVLAVVAVAAAVQAPTGSTRRRGWSLLAMGVGLVAVIQLIVPEVPDAVVDSPSPPTTVTDVSEVIAPPQDPEFVGAEACRRCHADQFGSWHDTYHRTMTQVASTESVLAPFDDLTLTSRDRKFELQQTGDEFWVEMPDPALELKLGVQAAQGKLTEEEVTAAVNEKRVRLPVVMTTGSHLHQTYWVPGPGKTLFQFPWVYHIEHERWVPRYDSFLAPPHKDAFFNVWNVTCVLCHATAGVPGQYEDQRVLQTQAELGIACEACHGPGREHVERHRGAELTSLAPLADRAPDPTIVHPGRLDHVRSSQVCGQCHSYFHQSPAQYQRWLTEGKSFRPGDDLEEHVRVLRYDPEGHTEWIREALTKEPEMFTHQYWPDGTARTGGREYSGLLETACYLEGEMSCVSCHSMHESDPDNQVAKRMETNLACTQCHTDDQYVANVSDHTHHPAGSSGSLCYNCHMPHTTYVLMGAVRSHRITPPEVVTGVQGARPNACNLCHLDKTLDWTQQHLSDWHGTPRVKLTDDEQTISAGLLWLLKGDATQRLMVAWSMGWEPAQQASGTDWQPPFLALLLSDPYSAIRDVAHRSLTTLPGYGEIAFDFLNEADFQRVTNQVISRWNKAHDGQADPDLLITGPGTVNRAEVESLLKNRDDRPIRISE